MLARTSFICSPLVLGLMIALAGCGDDDGSDPGDAGDPGLDAGSDAGPPGPDVCEQDDLPRVSMISEGTGNRFGEIAGDFTVETLSGTWRLSDAWSGCESYVFFTHFPSTASNALFATELDNLVLRGPRNVRYFFMSEDPDAAARRMRMESVAANLEGALNAWVQDEAQRAFWRARFHFVLDQASEVEGSVGAHLRDYLEYQASDEAVVDLGDRGMARAPAPSVFAIDRAQRWEPADNLAPSVAEPPQLGMAAYFGHYYNYLATLDARLASDGATEVSVLDERTTGRVFTREVALPDAATMAAFDSLEVEVEITCENRNPFGCSEWDRNAYVQLCSNEDCSEKLEIARWITPYWRRGRQHWVIDATPFLGLLREGGARSFFVELGPDWERPTEWVAKVALRMRTQGSLPRAVGAQRAFIGGVFDATYNTREPFRFTPPATATRVELVTIVSGHEQLETNGCAEWCDHRHVFSVNGTALPELRHTGRIGGPAGCAQRASEGVLPGQWGNWAQSRAYWCPGLPVDTVRTDITANVRLGEENEMTYAGRFGTGDPAGGNVVLSAYVVWYE